MKFLIAGLGNIGSEYSNTRHNIGFILADALALAAGAVFKTERYADVARIRYRGKTLIVIKPSTYMNLSGKAVRYWMQKENIVEEQLLAVVDDIALPTGALRMKAKGGDGGHNGLQSIIEYLGSEAFPRLRIGIGNDFAQGSQVDYVLGKWTKPEEETMLKKIPVAVEMVKSFVANGLERTMNQYNE
ncbi:MAG: aminoacyl-tRNA hydrolase [Bacteroidetes bacterium]|nr:aminoacyl-tRNA hydrolase [Bacteroidota bacterium]